MTEENWDSYICRVEDKPASILVDLGRVVDAPRSDRPLLGYVRVSLNDPDEHGFPRQAEYDRLAEVEDALEEVLRKELSAQYVGRSACDGRFDFFFYLPEDADWEAGLRGAMAPFGEYAWDGGAYLDPEWETYGQFLFPDMYAMLGIQNKRVRRQMRERGDDTAKNRRVEHWASFPDFATARAFAETATQRGFNVEELRRAGEGEENDDAIVDAGGNGDAIVDAGGNGDAIVDESGNSGAIAEEGVAPAELVQVCLSRPDTPDGIDDVTFALTDLALEYGGVYQGWACPILD